MRAEWLKIFLRAMDPQMVPTPLWAKRWAFDRQLHRTEMCHFQRHRGCGRNNCPFAHTPQELRAKPALRKTTICQEWRQGRCNNRFTCDFAHGEDDIHAAGLYKTHLCHWYALGRCRKGRFCRHAHGQAELRAPGPGDVRNANLEEMPAKVCLATMV